MSARMKDTTSELSAEYLLALTYEDFNVFRQADMIKMMSKSTSPPTSYQPKTRQAFLPQHYDLFDEPDSESATETLLDQEKVDSSPSPPFQSSSMEGSKDLPEFIFTLMTCTLHLITHLMMWINIVISVTPPAPLIVWMNQLH